MRICFFAPLEDRSAFEYNQFYAQDVRILRELSSELVLATNWSEIPWDCDAYFVWWWTWAFLPLAKALRRRRPVVITGVFDLDNPDGGYHDRPPYQRAAMAAALCGAHRNVFVSHLEYGRVPQVLPTRGACYAPLVVDGDLHPYCDRPTGSFLLTICWLESANAKRKGVDLAISAHALALARHPDLELLIAGAPGSAVPELERLVRSVHSEHRVRFLGRVSHERKVRLLQTCRAYLQPSNFEGFGVAAAEAMACGAPVIASRRGTLPEVLGENAIYIGARTPEAVAAAIEQAYDARGSSRCREGADSIRDRFRYERRRHALGDAIAAAITQAGESRVS